MLLIWIDLVRGNREAAALLVAMNTVLQVLGDALLGAFHLRIFPAWLGFDAQIVRFSFGEIALINIWGVTSLQALAGVISPLIEVPLLVKP